MSEKIVNVNNKGPQASAPVAANSNGATASASASPSSGNAVKNAQVKRNVVEDAVSSNVSEEEQSMENENENENGEDDDMASSDEEEEEGSGEEDGEEEDDASYNTEDALANDPLFFVLSKLLVTTESQRNIADLLEELIQVLRSGKNNASNAVNINSGSF